MYVGRKGQMPKALMARGAGHHAVGAGVKDFDPSSSAELILDAAVEFTFPASDPISVDHAFMSASLRTRNVVGTRDPATSDKARSRSARKIKRLASTSRSK